MSASILKNYSIGLDIGIASIGWAVLDMAKKRIVALGVRLFEGAEEPKTGAPLAAPRREARSARRRLRRKRRRLADIRNLIAENKRLTAQEMESLFSVTQQSTPWELRADGLNRLLSPAEWARVLIHMAKHRGFKSNKKIQPEGSKQNEEGKALTGIKENSRLLKEGNDGKGYRTIGELMQNDPKFSSHKRNRDGQYTNSILRGDIEEEIKTLFNCQREYGSEGATQEIEAGYTEIFSRQLPFSSGGQIIDKVGRCPLEPAEKRAPRASWTAERFILLSEIAKIKVRVDGQKLSLGSEQTKIIEELAYKNAKVTYKQIRAALASDGDWCFEKLPYAKKGEDPEEKQFIALKAWHAFRKTITTALGKEYWEKIIQTPSILDEAAYALTFKKDDKEIISYLESKGIDERLISAILPLNFTGVVNLSKLAMSKLIPFMEEEGCRYDEACAKAGYQHYKRKEKERALKLPVPDWDEIRNPVVIRAISETRKVINAITAKYGPPASVQIELARDLSHSRDERNKIQKAQEENRSLKEKLAKDFQEKFEHQPNSKELEKYRLWKEQNGFCIYTGSYLSPNDVFNGSGDNYAEIDHIIPKSISFDDSFTNKVLVLTGANREKGCRIPFEYLGGDPDRWEEYLARVGANIKNRNKANRLKIKSLDESDISEIKERSLGDTRHITEYVANWLEESLLFSETASRRPVTRINGQATCLLRWQWGINALKDRDKNCLHHALDAAVAAAATPGIIKTISDYSRRRELQQLKTVGTGKKERCPEPWENFRKEVEARLSENPAEKIREYGLKNYSEEELSESGAIFVSRRPCRGATGAAHKETIASAKYLDEGKIVIKRPLSSIKLNDLENMVGKERDRALYNALKERLNECKNDPKKAFASEFRKPAREGRPGPVVRSIKIYDTHTSGIKINKGIAGNLNMARIDIYTKGGEYFIVPNYVSDIAQKIKRDRAIVGKKEEKDWVKIDSSFTFVFSLHKDDLIRVKSKKRDIFGYYKGCDRSTAAIDLITHDGSKSYHGIGLKTAELLEKYEVEILGSYHKVRKEKPPYELA